MKFYRHRFFIVVGCLFLLFGVAYFRAAWLQILPDTKLKSLKEKQFQKIVTLQPTRGLIYDRNKVELASSITAYSLFADPSLIQTPRRESYKIARILGMTPKSIFRMISDKNKKFVWIERKMPKVKKEMIEHLGIHGLGFVEESQRIYPNHNLLSQTLGFVGEEGQGLGGLESKYNDELSGLRQKFLVQKDARGRPLLVNGKLFSEQPDGATIVLTIDSELQYNLEQELKKSVEENSADDAVGVIMDVQSNEVLALSSVPDFNPNDALKAQAETRKNRVISDPFEPGSVMKPFIVAGALRAGILEPNTKYFCENGSMRVADRIIREASPKEKFGWLTVNEILAKSSNVGMVKVGFQLGAEKVKKVLDDFGFGQKTGIVLGGDSRGIVAPLPWREVRLANASFGQGLAATGLQIANAYTALANGGVLKEPLLVKSIYDPATGSEENFESKVVRKVLTSDQAKIMLLMLMNVTQQEGTAFSARVQGYPVAGKTGTAQIASHNGTGYLKNAYTSSFAGIIPANDPRYVIYIAVDNPKKKHHGADVAAPVFARIASYAIRRAGMSPVLLTEQNVIGAHSHVAKKTKDAVMKLAKQINQQIPQTDEDKFVGLSVLDVIEKAHDQNVQVKVFGSGHSYKVISEDGIVGPDHHKILKVYFR